MRNQPFQQPADTTRENVNHERLRAQNGSTKLVEAVLGVNLRFHSLSLFGLHDRYLFLDFVTVM